MSKELESIVEEFANKLLKALKGSGASSESSKGDDTEKTSQPATETSKINLGTKDPAERAQELAIMGEELRLQLQLNEAQADFFEMREAAIDLLEHEKKIKAELEEAINDENAAATKALQAELANIQAIAAPYRKFVEGKQKASNLNKEMKRTSDQYFNSLASKLGLTTKLQDTYIGKFMNFSKMLMAKGGAKTFFQSLATSLLNLPLSILDSIVNTTIEMIFAFDKAVSSFAGATGFADKYSRQIISGAEANIRLGISADDMSKSMLAVTSVMANTSSMSKDLVKSLAETAAQLEKIGVASEDTAMAMKLFVNVGGMMEEEAMKMTKQLFQMGKAIDVTARQMSKDFVMAMSTLAVYGTSKANDMFLKLTAAAKASGVEMNTLLGIAGKFDTFQSAAETVGKLNAILGTQMSTTEMITMTEEQRVETIIQQIQMSGRSFRDLDRYTQKAIAASVGITDMKEANLLFGMSMVQYQKHQEDMKKQEASQKTLNDAIKAAQPVMDRVKIAFMQLFVASEDFIMSIRDGTKAVVDFIQENKEQIKTGLLVYAGFRVAIPLLRTFGMLTRGLTFLTNLFTSSQAKEAAQTKINNVIKGETIIVNQGVGSSSRFAAGGILAIGAALALAFIGIGVMVKGVASLAEALKGMNSEEVQNLENLLIGISVGLGVFSFAIVAAGAAATKSALGIAVISGAVLSVGASVGMASAGIGVMAMGLAMMTEQGFASIGMLVALGLGFTLMIMQIAGTAMVASPATPIIYALGIAIALVGAGAYLMAEALNISIGALKGIDKVADGTTDMITALAGGFFLLSAAAFILGKPPALIGAGIILGIMVAAAAISSAQASIAGSTAQATQDVAKLAEDLDTTNLEKVTTAINSIANAIQNVDMALGKGARRLEILAVFSDLAAISASGTPSSRPAAMVSTAQAQFTNTMNNNLTNNRTKSNVDPAEAMMRLVKAIEKTPMSGKEKFDLQLYIDGEELAARLDPKLDKLGRRK